MPREMAWGTYAGGSGYESLPYIYSLPDAVLHAQSQPENLGAQLSAIGRTRDYQVQVYSYGQTNYRPPDWIRPYYDEDEGQDSLPVPDTKEWFKRIQGRFSEPWLPAYLASVRRWNESEAFDMFYNAANRADQLQWLQSHRVLSSQTRQIRAELEAGARREPKNAFWIWKLAQWEWAYSPRSFYPPPRSNFAFTPLTIPAIPAIALPAPSLPGAGSGIDPMAPLPGGLSSAYSDFMLMMGPYPLPQFVPREEDVLRRTFAILQRARACTYFEDGYWQANLHIKRDLQAIRPMALETSNEFFNSAANGRESVAAQFVLQLRSSLWAPCRTSFYSNPSIVVPYASNIPSVPLAERTSPREMLMWAAGIAHLARLRERSNPFSYSYSGRSNVFSQWLEPAWELDVAPPALGVRRVRTSIAAKALIFAAKARRLGRPDVARDTVAMQQEFAARNALCSRANTREYFISSRGGGLWPRRGADALMPQFAFASATMCFGIASSIFCLCPIWMLLNIWLARGIGAPSPRIARWGPAIVITVVLGIPLLWVVYQLKTTSFVWLQLITSSPFMLVILLVNLLALWCVALTIGKQRIALVSPENESWHTHFISRDFRPWVEPLLLASSVFIIAIASAVFIYFVQVPGVGSTPIPLSFVSVYTVQDAFGALAIYGIGAGGVALLILFGNWRWPVKSVRPVTHTGLRWWKECIGASICVLAWMYLGIALMAWPARTRAKNMIEERWQMGDWVWLQKNL